MHMDGHKVAWEQRQLNHSDSGEMIRIKIGSASITVTGKHRYTIGYKVKKGILPSSLNTQKDAIRWNAIGTGWQIPIEQTEINLYLPSSLDQNNVLVRAFQGQYGSKQSSNTANWINQNHLQLNASPLAPHQGITIEASYPAGTLDQTGTENMANTLSELFLAYWHWPVLIGVLLYLFYFFKQYSGMTDKRSIAPQYDLPQGMSTLQAGLLYDRFTNNEDFSAAVLELAQKGYLEIFQKEKEDEPLLKKTSKNTEELSSDLKYLMDNILFSQKRSFQLTAYSTDGSSTLQSGFHKVNQSLYQWSVENGYIREDPKPIRKKLLTTSIRILIPIFILSLYTVFTMYGITAALILLFSSIFIGVGTFTILVSQDIFQKIMGIVFILVGVILLIKVLSFQTAWSIFLFSPMSAIIIMIIAVYTLYRHIGAYTRKGAEARTHILGLKEYMSRVKEDEIQRRLKDDPLYLEKYLPYAVLFGITEHWLSLFGAMNVSYPLWYHGSFAHISDFSSNMNNAATPPASSSGGASGSGGFSGGGAGGGGGGSW